MGDPDSLCSRCGAPLSARAAEGFCPKCLLRLGLEGDAGGEDDSADSPPTEAAPTPQVAPERIGPYRILQVLGEGGMGIVYLAEQVEPIRRRVALKVVKPGMDTREVLARFEAERQALAVMSHANVARVFEAGATEQGRPYFVMEYVPGIRITEYCDMRCLSVRERLELFTEVCEAIQHAHQKGVIHRDIKPSNVLVSSEEGKAVLKVIDFGLAKATGQPLTARTLFTQQGVLIGTPEYMSPEQAGTTPLDVDARTDIYSLGVLLYELLVGALPFDPTALRRAAAVEMLRIIQEEDPPRPTTKFGSLGETASEVARRRHTDIRSLARQLRGELEWITMRAMEKDPDHRYPSASELAADVKRHLKNEPIVAGPPSRLYRLKKLVRRHRAAVSAAAVSFAVLLAGVAVCVGGWLAWRSWRAPAPPVAGNFAIAVAPFTSVTDAGKERGRAYRDLIEREVRRRAGEAPVRVLEGQLHEPIESESEAREVGQRLGADAVCWGKLLGVGREEEVEARITPIRRIEKAAAGSVEVSLSLDPRALLELVRRIPLDSPNQIGILASKAEEVADLVSTLVGLAQIRAGQYAEASRTLAALEKPTPDQRFYQGLAKLRSDDRAAAEDLFRQVLADDPKHSGARLGILLSRRSGSPFPIGLGVPDPDSYPRDEESRRLTLEGLAGDPVNPELNVLLALDLLSACQTGEQVCEEMAANYRKHILSLCDRPAAEIASPMLLPLMVVTLSAFEWSGKPGVALTPEELAGCPAFVTALERDDYLRGVVCVMNAESPRSRALLARCCDDWHPVPDSIPPMLYAYLIASRAERDRAGAPVDFSEIADRDPRLEERVRDWAYAISFGGHTDKEEDEYALKAVAWLRRHPGAGTEKGRRKAVEGVLLMQAHRPDEAQRAFKDAQGILGEDEEVQRGLAICHLAAGQFDRAMTDLGSAAVPERPLALAASGRIREAYEALPGKRDISSGAGTGTAAEAATWRIMNRLASEIESDQVVRSVVSLEFGRRIQKVASDVEFELAFGWNFSVEDDTAISPRIEFEPVQSMKFGLADVLPKDPLSLLALVQSSIDSSSGENANPEDAEQLAAFVKRLSSLVREAVSEDAGK